MKTKAILGLLPALALLATFATQLPAASLGTAFTYQGHLAVDNNSAAGIYDLKFSLYDAESDGQQVGPALTNAAVLVSNGTFTVTLDFGNVFNGNACWLEIGVRTSGGGAFTTLPRQPVTPTPFALWSLMAGSVPPGTITSAALADDAVTSDKIAAGTVTFADIGQNAASHGQVIQWNATQNQWIAGWASGGVTLLGYKENGAFASPPIASGTNAIALGEHAQALGNNSVVGGGLDNLANHWFTTVSGGWSNSAGGFLFGRTTVGGGEMNLATGDWSTVAGGQRNTAGGPLYGRATVAGGWENTASGDMSVISGGSQNSAVIGHAAIGGGQYNVISNGAWSTIGGGYSNRVWGLAASAGGGSGNQVANSYGTIGGGGRNQSLGFSATVGGGYENLASGQDSTVGGGYQNQATNHSTTVGGGHFNQSLGAGATIGGGGGNRTEAGAVYSAIGGGDANTNAGLRATISGGYNNVVGTGADNSVIGGGRWNTVQEGAYDATIPGGQNNRAGSPYTFAAGRRAKANHTGAFVWADSGNADFASTANNQFLIRAAGGVGIGTTNPEAALHVAGAVKAAAFISDGSQLSGPPAGMVLIPAGEFTMGDTLDGDPGALPVSAYVSALYMDAHEVSWSRWQSVYFWATNQGYAFANFGAGKAANHPVQTVNWFDCVKWCNARSQQAGLTPVYYTDAPLTAVYRNGEVAPYANWSANGYRLPTEAEWEKAARGALSGQRFPWGNLINQNLANYRGDTNYSYDLGPNGFHPAFATGEQPYTSPGGYFAPNSYGLYDMAGNVQEWCWDWYGAPYAGGSDPCGPASGSSRVLRSGACGGGPYVARCADRRDHIPAGANYYGGFRCVKGL